MEKTKLQKSWTEKKDINTNVKIFIAWEVHQNTMKNSHQFYFESLELTISYKDPERKKINKWIKIKRKKWKWEVKKTGKKQIKMEM